jgi:hypothetical protein
LFDALLSNGRDSLNYAIRSKCKAYSKQSFYEQILKKLLPNKFGLRIKILAANSKFNTQPTKQLSKQHRKGTKERT